MNISVKPEDLNDAVAGQLKDWSNLELRKAVNKGIEDTAATVAKELRKGGPYRKRTGKYEKDWAHSHSKISRSTGLDEYSVHNRKQYRLTHLLEKGHQVSRGGRAIGRAKAYAHIAPAEEIAEQLVISNVEKRVREIG